MGISTEKKALLYGGGIDSYCTYHLLKRDGVIFDTIRFDLKTRCAEYEREAIEQQDVEIDAEGTLDLGILEHDDAHLPYRNLMMATFAASLGYTDIMLGGTKDDRSSDMTESGFASMSRVLTALESKSITVYAPYGRMTKHELASEFMKLGKHEEQLERLKSTFSCYEPVDRGDHHCLYCKACLRRVINIAPFENYPPYDFHNRGLLINEYRRIVVKEDVHTTDRMVTTRNALESMMTKNEIQLASMMYTYVVDLDGTLCSEKRPYDPGYYETAEPIIGMIAAVNTIYNAGHEVVIYTSRYPEDEEVTRNWLRENGVKFDRLLMGKINYDFWVDDRGLSTHNFHKLGV